MLSGELSAKSFLERHNRSIPILGLAGEKRLAESIVVIAGIGAVGSVATEILVRQGVGVIVAIDNDRTIENHNLDRQFLYRESQIEKPKALATKEAAEEINKEVRIIPYVGTFTQATNSSLREVICSADLIISAIDNELGRYSVARFAYIHNIPHLDGATGGFNCRTYIFPSPQKGPCYLCTLTRKDYEEISAIFSCTRRTDEKIIAPAITETGVQAGNILAIEAVKLLVGLPSQYNEIRVNLLDWQIMAEKIGISRSHFKGHMWI